MSNRQPVRVGSAFMAAFGLLILSQPTKAGPALQQTGAGVQAGEPKFRLVRSISGSKGSQRGGQYVIEDPRTMFYVPDDNKVIVYLEWEGPLGPHHLEGIWKNPEGKVASLSDFDYESKQKRFGAYFSVPLSEAIPTGLWSLEARIDGELAGTHTFQIVAAARPASAVPTKHMLTPAEIYQRALAATVVVEGLDANGENLGAGSGFFVADNLVLTGFENIDGASSARLVLSDGTRLQAQGVLTFSRLNDWALLGVRTPKSSALPIAAADSWQVGDHCFSLDEPQEGNRTIVDGNITGKRRFPEIGDRLNLSFGLQSPASGSPLLNEYGEVIGMVAVRSMLPGSRSLDAMRSTLGLAYPSNLHSPDSPLLSQNELAIPISAVPLEMAGGPVSSFSQLSRDGRFTPPLAGFENILRGTAAKRVDHKGSQWEPVDQRFEYSHQDGRVVIFITWNTRNKLKGLASLRLYSLNNELLTSTRPTKVSFSKGQMSYMTYPLDISNAPSGTYRIDLAIENTPVWRTFIRVVD
jgi:S1-C subfamily serine protease